MGLETLEFVVDVENAFDLKISDADVATIRTPRDFVAYLAARLEAVDSKAGAIVPRWTPTEIEQVVEGLLVRTLDRMDFTLDTEFRDLFG